MTTATNPLKVLESYTDLCNEIDYFNTILQDIQREWQINRNLMFFNPSGRHGGYVPVGMDRVAERLDTIRDRHDEVESYVKEKKKLKRELEDVMKRFTGLEYKVMYKRFVEHKTLNEIAVDLGYSYQYIKEVSSRINLPQTY